MNDIDRIKKACIGQRYPISNMEELGYKYVDHDSFETIFEKEGTRVIFYTETQTVEVRSIWKD